MILYIIRSEEKVRGGRILNDQRRVGEVNRKVIDTFGLSISEGVDIFCGPGNIEHMKKEHPEDFEKYFGHIEEIISSPTYICKHPNKDSIEYVKVFIDENNDHVLVAVRASGRGVLFARTLFVMDDEKVEKYNNKNAFKPY